jgi:hypothetical protein
VVKFFTAFVLSLRARVLSPSIGDSPPVPVLRSIVLQSAISARMRIIAQILLYFAQNLNKYPAFAPKFGRYLEKAYRITITLRQ